MTGAALAIFMRELADDPYRVRALERERFTKTTTKPRGKRAHERA